MPVRLLQVDAFTDVPFRGNPAAVALLDGPAPASWMQAVAGEMNLAETAFVHPAGDGYSLRWFTPACEVDLCGHATLAAAHALWEEGRLSRDREARFATRSGELVARHRPDGSIAMDFPAAEVVPGPAPDAVVASVVGDPGRAAYCGRNRLDVHLFLLDDEAAVRALVPDLRGLAATGVHAALVTAPSSAPGIDFVSRFFAPALGIDEDPVTGSAHCALAPFWAARLGRPALRGYQASARGGVVEVEVRGDRVGLAGRAVTVLAGELRA